MNAVTENIHKPWYRQFWPWVIILIPVATVIAGITTLFIAMQYRDPLVVDEYYKEGLGINRVLEAQQQAAALHMRAQAHHEPASGQLSLHISGQAPPVSALRLRLIHTTRKDLDRELMLVKTAQGDFSAKLQQINPGRWNMILTPPDSHWRLDANITLPASNWLFKPDI